MHLSASFELLDRFYVVEIQFGLACDALSKKNVHLENFDKNRFSSCKGLIFAVLRISFAG